MTATSATVTASSSSSSSSVADGSSKLVRGSVASGVALALSPALSLQMVTRGDGEGSRDWATLESPLQCCCVCLEGYLVMRFRDAGNESREAVMDRVGDYALFTASVPHRFESITASKCILITVHGASQTASFFSANAASQEGAFFAGQSSLAVASTLRKSFPASLGWQSLGAGESGKPDARSSRVALLLIRGKLSVRCVGQSVSLVVMGEFVECPAHENIAWTALAPHTVALTIVVPKK